MRFDRLHKAIAYLGAGLGLAAIMAGAELEVATRVLVIAGFAGSWFVEGPILQRPAYGRFWNGAVLGFFVLQALRAVMGEPWLVLGVEYAAFLQVSRLFHRRSAREYQQIAVLAFLHLIAATVLTSGLEYAFIFFGFVIVTPWMLALTHLRTEIERHYGPAAQADGGVPRAAQVMRSRSLAGSPFLLGTAALAVPLFLLTAGLFLLFPRVGMGFLSFRADTGQRVAGFGRNVELGGFGVIRDDPTVVMRVRMVEGAEVPGAGLALRMRGTSFDHYDGLRWTRTPLPGRPLPHMFDRYAIDRWPEPEDRELTIALDPLDEPVVFLPQGTVALSVPPRVRGGRDVARRLVHSPGLDVRYTDRDGLGLVYSAHVAPDGRVPPTQLTDEARQRYLQVPAGHDATAALARRLTRGADTPAERARRVLTHLRDSGRFDYSLRQPDPEGRPPLEAFLTRARSGHCEYFSTAMAIMLRAVGVPARNVTGYVGGRYNDFGDYVAIRQGDAHSWVEAHVDGRWRTYDPTPPARHALGPQEGAFDSLRAFVDALETRWSNDVVGYDLRDQVRGFRRAMRWLGLWRPRSGTRPEAVDDGGGWDWSPAGSGAGAMLLGLLVLLVLGALAWVAWRFRARRTGGRREAAVRLYCALEKRLRRMGRPRPPAVTPRAHARALEDEGLEGADTVRDVTDAYLGARYGGQPLDPAALRALHDRIRRLPRRPRPSAG